MATLLNEQRVARSGQIQPSKLEFIYWFLSSHCFSILSFIFRLIWQIIKRTTAYAPQTVHNKHKFVISHGKRLVMNEMPVQWLATTKRRKNNSRSSSSTMALMTRYMEIMSLCGCNDYANFIRLFSSLEVRAETAFWWDGIAEGVYPSEIDTERKIDWPYYCKQQFNAWLCCVSYTLHNHRLIGVKCCMKRHANCAFVFKPHSQSRLYIFAKNTRKPNIFVHVLD